jgi:PAS domain S-box-containing protein
VCGKVVWFAVGSTDGLCLPGQPGWSLQPAVVDDGPVEVCLTGLPLGLYDVLRQHNDSLVREYQIHLLSQEPAADATPPDAREDLARAARARLTVADAVREAARAAGALADDPVARLDVSFQVSVDDAAACAMLPTVLDQAEALAREGRFLTRPALPELVSLRNWLFPEVAAQARGAEPTCWSVEGALVEPPPVPHIPVDLEWVRHTHRGVVVADEDNRILAVSTTAATMLGWEPDGLAGRRLTCIVPPRYREAHVTGYARHVHTGTAHVLGVDVELPALRRDGTEVAVRLRIEQRETAGGGLYLGWLEAVHPPED